MGTDQFDVVGVHYLGEITVHLLQIEIFGLRTDLEFDVGQAEFFDDSAEDVKEEDRPLILDE